VKVKISRKDLLSGIQRVQGVVERRNTMPILTHILMEAEGQNIMLFATDLEVGIQGSYSAEVLEPGRITVSAVKLHEIIREFPEGLICLTSQENHWVIIESGKSFFRIVGLPPEEFPVPASIESDQIIQINQTLLSDLIRRTLFATGENNSQYILNGFLIQLEKTNAGTGIIRFITTDGHRLAVAEGKVSGDWSEREDGVILPKKAILEIKRALDEGNEIEEPQLSISENQLIYRWGTFVIASRLIEGDFPNYKKALPENNDKKIPVQKEDLEGGLRRVSILAREKTSAIKFTLEEGHILLSAKNPEMGEANEALETSFKEEGFSTGFNARYLIDALSVLRGEEVTLEFKDATSPCLIREESEGFLTVIMPMRV